MLECLKCWNELDNHLRGAYGMAKSFLLVKVVNGTRRLFMRNDVL